jgi:hypothetical protein
MTRTIVSTEGLLSTGAMARQLGISANVLRDHLGDLALRDERRLYWWDEAKTRAAAARCVRVQIALGVKPEPAAPSAQPAFTEGLLEQALYAPRVAVLFKDREQRGGFVSVYKVAAGQRLPNRPRDLAPGLWLTHSGAPGEMPCPFTLAELRRQHEADGCADDGAQIFLPRLETTARARAIAAEVAEEMEAQVAAPRRRRREPRSPVGAAL